MDITPIRSDAEMKRQIEASDRLFADVTSFVVFNQIQGDYFEFGVFRGDSLARIHDWLNVHWSEFSAIGNDHEVIIPFDPDYLVKKRFFAFDSFQGLPPSSGKDTPIHFAAGTYRASEAEFLQNITRQGVDVSKVIAIPGWFESTLSEETKRKQNMERAALIFIDCDLWEAANQVFAFITSLVQDGTVLIMDDFFRYKGHPHKGVQGAFNKWRHNNPGICLSELTRCGANRVAFVCTRIGPNVERGKDNVPQ